jgi:hypothetical protein
LKHSACWFAGTSGTYDSTKGEIFGFFWLDGLLDDDDDDADDEAAAPPTPATLPAATWGDVLGVLLLAEDMLPTSTSHPYRRQVCR